MTDTSPVNVEEPREAALGRYAYEAYCDYSGGKSLVSGAQLPEWEGQAPGIREAWIAAAMRVDAIAKGAAANEKLASVPFTRAKFACTSVERFGPGPEDEQPCTYRFAPQYDTSIPEDQRFTRYTPSGSLSMTVDNPNVRFEPGKQYYLDFTPAEEG